MQVIANNAISMLFAGSFAVGNAATSVAALSAAGGDGTGDAARAAAAAELRDAVRREIATWPEAERVPGGPLDFDRCVMASCCRCRCRLSHNHHSCVVVRDTSWLGEQKSKCESRVGCSPRGCRVYTSPVIDSAVTEILRWAPPIGGAFRKTVRCVGGVRQ